MKLKVIFIPDERLRAKSEIVPLPLSKEDRDLADSLADYLEFAAQEDNNLRAGIGIAAPQVGELKRIFAIRIPFGNDIFLKEVLVNPQIVSSSGKVALADGEGCLSVLIDQPGIVHRKQKIKIKGYSASKDQDVEYELEDYAAIVFQHEMDHLDGKIYTDHIDNKNPSLTKKGEVLI